MYTLKIPNVVPKWHPQCMHFGNRSLAIRDTGALIKEATNPLLNCLYSGLWHRVAFLEDGKHLQDWCHSPEDHSLIFTAIKTSNLISLGWIKLKYLTRQLHNFIVSFLEANHNLPTFLRFRPGTSKWFICNTIYIRITLYWPFK
jgi:hypothetical protein